jgi:hypothetical protein
MIDKGLIFCGLVNNVDTSTGADNRNAPIMFDAAKLNGTSTTSLGTGDHLATFHNNGSWRMQLNGNGDLSARGEIYANSTNMVAQGGGSTGGTTTANGTVTLIINGSTYYLLKAAAA